MTELFRKQFLVIISEKIFPWDVWYHFRIIWEWFAARNKNVFNSIFINLPKNALKCISSNFDCFFECEFSKKIINKLWMKKWENCLIISTAKEMNLSLYLRWKPKERKEILSKWMTVIKNIFKNFSKSTQFIWPSLNWFKWSAVSFDIFLDVASFFETWLSCFSWSKENIKNSLFFVNIFRLSYVI